MQEPALAGVRRARRGPGPGRRAPRGPSRGRPGTPRSRRGPSATRSPQVLGRARHRPGSGSAMPTIAIGSSSRGATRGRRRGPRPAPPAARAARRAGSRRARPASGSRRPASPAAAARWPPSSRLRSSTAVSESKPSSLNARSGVDRVGAGVAEHGRHLSRTSRAARCSCSAAGRPASRARQASAPAARRRRRPPRAGRRRTSPRSSGGIAVGRCVAQAGAGRAAIGTSSASSSAARRRTARAPRPGGSGARPPRRIRRRSASVEVPGHAAALLPTGPTPARRRAGPAARRLLGERVEEARSPPRSCACPGAPNTPAADENSTNADRSRSRVSSCRCQRRVRPSAAAPRRSRSGVSEPITPSSSTPAAWTTAVSGCSARDRGQQRGQRVAVRHVAGRRPSTSAPSSARARRASSAAPSARRAAAAGQQQVPHAVLGRPGGGPPARRARRCRR